MLYVLSTGSDGHSGIRNTGLYLQVSEEGFLLFALYGAASYDT